MPAWAPGPGSGLELQGGTAGNVTATENSSCSPGLAEDRFTL